MVQATRLRDTIIKVEKDSSLIRALIKCDSLCRAYVGELIEFKSGKHVSPPKVVMENNVLTATAAVDSFSIYAQLKDRYVEKVSKTMTTPPPIEVNRLTWWQTLWVALGRILSAALLCLLVFTAFKRKLKTN